MERERQLEERVIDISLESLRLARTFEVLLAQFEDYQVQKYASKISFFHRALRQRLEQVGISIADSPMPGDRYDVGLPVSVVNIQDFLEDDALVIDSVLAPTFVDVRGGLKRAGSVTVRKAEQ